MMKKPAIYCLLAGLIALGCREGSPAHVYYRIDTDGPPLTRAQYDSAKLRILEGMQAIVAGVALKEALIDSTAFGDSIVLSYRLEFDNFESKEKIYDFEGRQLPQQSLDRYPEGSLSLSELQGKPVWLNFWFTTCKPCVEEMPVLNRLRERFAGRVHFVAVTYEPRPAVADFLAKHPFDFEHAINAQPLIDSLGIKTFPKNLFLDRDGRLRHIEDGIPYVFKDGNFDEASMEMGDGEAFAALLEALLQ